MLENQIKEDKQGGNNFKVCFVLFVLGALLCPTMKLFVKRLFLYLVEDIDSIKKMNLVEFVLSYLVHGIVEFKRKKLSEICSCPLFFMVMSLYIIYVIVNFEFFIKDFVTIYSCKIYFQLFYHEYILF